MLKLMKKTSVLSALGLALTAILLVGCSSNNQGGEAAVQKYNNQLADIQTNMFQDAQNLSNRMDSESFDTPKLIDELHGVLNNVRKSQAEFKAIKTPQGGEELAKALEHFFLVEIDGMTVIIDMAEELRHKTDVMLAEALMSQMNDFQRREIEAIKKFRDTQEEVAAKYGKKLVN